MKKRAKILIAAFCAVATFVPTGLAGFAGNMAKVEAAEASVNVTASDDSKTSYYDLADGDYYLAGSSITVNGESKLSGSALSIAGDYTITVTSAGGTTTKQDVVLYRRGDTHPDGKMDSRDVVALKKYQAGMEITKAGAVAVELTDDVLIDDFDAGMIRKLVSGEIDWKTQLPQFKTPVNYGSGTDAEMPISGFTGPFLDETSTDVPSKALTDTRTDAIYSMISDMGINLIATTPNKLASGTNVEAVLQSELALAEKYGLDMYVNASYLGNVESQTDELLKQYISNFGAYSSFKGITLVDEPMGVTSGYPNINSSNQTMDAHDGLAQLLHKYSNLTGYTNLFPWWEKNGSQDSYKAYLQEYIERYNPKQISLDYYVYGDSGKNKNASKTEYFQNLAMIREAAKNGEIPFWIVVQAGGYFTDDRVNASTSNYYPTEGQMKWNVNTALAYGAKGITYYPLIQPFSYSNSGWFLSKTNDYQRSGLIGADGNKTKWYDYAKSINTQIQAIDNVLMNSSNEGIMATAESTAASEVGTTLSTYGQLQSVTSSGSAGALAGCFDYFGTKAFYVVNYDDASTQTITMKFNGNYSLAVTKAADVSIVNTTNNSYSVSLAAGEGVLVLVNADSNIVDTTNLQQVITQINALPEVVASEMPRDYTNVILAKEAYDALNTVERAQISSVAKEKLNALVASTSSYGVVGSVTGARGIDATYGNMTTLNLAGATKISDDVLSENIPAAYSDVVFYVYNPTSSVVKATYGNVSENLQANAWTKVTVSRDQFTSGNDLTFGAAVSGEWKVTDFYGKNSGDLLNRVMDAIHALPALNVLKLDDRAIVAEARAMYEELASDDKAKVENYQTLLDCEAKIIALEQEAQGKLPVVIDVREQGYGLPEDTPNALMTDETYGTVMTFSGASYFAIEKNQMSDAYKSSRSAVIYIYNPTAEKAYLGVQLGDNGWIHRDRLTLYPGQWNRVELFDRGATHTSGDASFVDNYITANETIYFYAVDAANAASTFAGDGWMATSVYGMNEYNLNNVVNDKVVYNVETNWGLGGTGTEAEVVTDEVFGKVFAFASANEFQLAADKKTTEFRFCDDVVFYLYNPTDTDVQGAIHCATCWNYKSYVNLKAKEWTRIVLANYGGTEDGHIVSGDHGIWFAMTLPAAADGSKWKMTNFYGTPKITDDGSAATVEALINALPEASTIKMPDDMKYLAAIDEAKKAYDALTSEQLMFINAEAVAKLNACLTATEGYTVVANAKTDTMLMAPDAVFEGSIDKEIHETAGPVFAMNVTSKANDNYAAGFRIEKDMSNRRIVFSIYNPTQLATELWLYADNWNNLGTQNIVAGWNKITLELDETQATGAIFGFIPGSFDVTNTKWLITSFYSVTDEAHLAEEVARVELLLQGMPSAEEITSLDETAKMESVRNARAAYDALGVNTSQVDASLVEKLVAAEAKITTLESITQQVATVEAMLEALKPAEQITTLDSAIVQAVEEARAAYDALGDNQSQVDATLVQKLVDCEEKIAALNVKPEGYVAYAESPAPHFDYYSNEENAAYASATLAPTTIAGATAQWSATVTITNQNGGYLRAYQGLNLTVEQLQEYQAQGYTHIRIPYYLEAPVDTSIYVHSNGWEWNYKESAVAVRNAWTNFDYSIEDLLMTYGGTATVLEGINTVKGAFGLMNINVTSSGDYKLYLGDAYMLKPAEESGVYVDYKSATTYFDYYNDPTNAAYANATLEDVEFEGQTAKWTATLNVTAQNGGYARVYEGLNLTVAELQAYKEQGYTHIRIPYYLEAPADTNIYVHNNGWEWNYKLSAAAVRNAWTNFDYPIDDLLMTYGGTATVLEGINSGGRGAFGLMNIQVNSVGTYKLYLGQAEMWKPEDVAVTYNSTTGHWFDYYYDGEGDAWTDAQLADVEVGGQTAKWSGSVNITAIGGGYLRAYQGLNISVAELQTYKEQGYTHVRIPYYLEAPADTSIYVHNNTWEWDYKLSSTAVRNAWTNFDYPIDDLLATYGSTTTILEAINSGGRGAFGLMNIQANAIGTYKLYLGEAALTMK